jgi:arginine/lysine/ornithine decarboxylase
VSPGEEIAVSRNSHKSVITGLIHTGAVPVWLEPEYDGGLEVAHGIVPETLEQALDTHPGCRAVLITTPSYYGVCSDVPRLAEIAHARDLPLVSDDAWALAYKFHPELPPFALDVGADLAIGSVHKPASVEGCVDQSLSSLRVVA